MRPIDADAALKALRKCQTYLYDARDPELKIELSSAEAAINNLPTIQSQSTAGQLNDSTQSTAQSTNLIDRQAAIDALDTAIEHYDGIAEECRKKADIERNDYMDMRDDAYEARQLAQWLNELKYLREKIEQLTIKPEPQWIPCSERMPEEPGYYITSNEYNGVGEDFYYDGHFWNADKNAYSVIAWMPKPKAYKPNK